MINRNDEIATFNPKGESLAGTQIREKLQRIGDFTPQEGLIGKILPHPEKLTPKDEIRYRKVITPINGRTVGYSVTEKDGVDPNGEDTVTIVGFHGAMGSDEVFQNFMRMFPDKKIRLISISAPLHGDTFNPKGEVSFESWMKDYVVPLLNQENSKNIISMGSSMGGLEALWLAKLMPDKLLGCVVDNPLLTPTDNLETAKILLAMLKEGLVFQKERRQKGREVFYSGPYEVDMKSGFNGMKLNLDSRSLINFLGTIPKNIIGDLVPEKVIYDKDPDFFVFTGRRDKATWAHKNRALIDSVIGDIKDKFFGIKRTSKYLGDVATYQSFRGGHLNGFDRPSEYYAANYNALRIILDKFTGGNEIEAEIAARSHM